MLSKLEKITLVMQMFLSGYGIKLNVDLHI